MTKLNIFIAGHRGMVGSELMRQLQQNPKVNLITASRDELDLASAHPETNNRLIFRQ